MAFTSDERQQLLAQRGIGHVVIERLEAAGFDSIQRLQSAGVDAAVDAVCQRLGSLAWANRRQAIARAVRRVAPVPLPPPLP